MVYYLGNREAVKKRKEKKRKKNGPWPFGNQAVQFSKTEKKKTETRRQYRGGGRSSNLGGATFEFLLTMLSWRRFAPPRSHSLTSAFWAPNIVTSLQLN